MMESQLIPAGYMAKFIVERPEWLIAKGVRDIYSVSNCISKDFTDYDPHWRHNGYWLYDSPTIILDIAKEEGIDISPATMCYLEVYPKEFNELDKSWEQFAPDPSFHTRVVLPPERELLGYDVVSFTVRTSPECSPLSCNHLAEEIETNEHCLLPSMKVAQDLLEQGRFDDSEPGPFRVFAVYKV